MLFTIGRFDYSIEFEYKRDDALWNQSCVRNGIIDRRFIAEQALACATSANIIMNKEDAIRSIEAHLEYLDANPPKPPLVQPNITICRILRGVKGASTKDMTLYLEGRAVRSVLDTFVKESGRKLALTNALSHSAANRHKPTKLFRNAAWEAFGYRGWLVEAHINGAITRTPKPESVPSMKIQPEHIGFFVPVCNNEMSKQNDKQKRSGLLSASQS